MSSIKENISIDNLTLELETGALAKQADGSVMIRCGGTVVMVNVVSSNETMKELDYFPLTVNYSERAYAAGKIPGGFFKRETKPGDKEVLVSRLIDRPIRPLFPDDYFNEVQVTAITLSADQVNPPDTLAIVGASAALNLSDIPFKKVIGAVRVSRVNGQFVANPTFQQMAESDLDLIVAGSRDAILMVEGGGLEVPEKEVLDAIKFAHEKLIHTIELQEKVIGKAGQKKRSYDGIALNQKLSETMKNKYEKALDELIRIKDKRERNKASTRFTLSILKELKPDDFGISDKELEIQVQKNLEEMESHIVRSLIFKKKVRIDERKLDEIRPISIQINVLPRVHGSAIFTRGQTQSLGVTTLGTVKDEQRFDDLLGEYTEKFMLHYNFPPFSVGECGRSGAPGRREIGHGNLALRSLDPVLPDDGVFPYTIRIVSDILESNGSSSMASVCSGCLSMLQAGVPLKGSVAGIAMGLIKEGDEFIVLSDIAGAEDHFGDMDFKVAGTRKGVTGVQMDIKIDGLTFEIMQKALEQSRQGRNFILDRMDQVIAKPAAEVSELAPRIITMNIEPSKIREVIGSGGSVIREITEKTGTDIDISDEGVVTISGKNLAAAESAREIVMGIVADPEIGRIYEGKVKRIMEFGAIVEFLPGKTGMVHISRLSQNRVRVVEDVVKLGDIVKVKIIRIDFDKGKQRIDLSMRDAQ